MTEIWDFIASERKVLVESLERLSDEEWAKPSLCGDWTNKNVLSHLVVTAEITTPKFLAGMARNGFRFHRMTAGAVRTASALPVEALLDRLRAAVSSHSKPPGPAATPLMETVVHGEDIAYPLAKPIAHDPDALVAAADFAKSAQPIVGCRKRIEGLALHATDHDWRTGEGPEVRGPLVALLLAMSGRRPACDALTGDGVALLRDRP